MFAGIIAGAQEVLIGLQGTAIILQHTCCRLRAGAIIIIIIITN